MAKEQQKPGPKADSLVIESDDWQEAVKKAVNVERPKGGWPKPEAKPDNPEEDG